MCIFKKDNWKKKNICLKYCWAVSFIRSVPWFLLNFISQFIANRRINKKNFKSWKRSFLQDNIFINLCNYKLCFYYCNFLFLLKVRFYIKKTLKSRWKSFDYYLDSIVGLILRGVCVLIGYTRISSLIHTDFLGTVLKETSGVTQKFITL